MNRGYIILLLLLITIPSVFSLGLIEKITSLAVTATTGIRITIDETAPDLNVSSVYNTTYNYLDSIFLNFTIYDQSPISSISYSLNGGANVTITGNTTFNAEEGENTFILYANDSLGHLNRTVVSFVVNSSMPDNIDLASFQEAGSLTTNVSILSKSQIQNLSNFIIHKVNDGRIVFGVPVNLSNDGKNHSWNPIKQVNVSAYVNISYNRIYIDSSNLLNLNKTATLYLYNLTFSNPIIQRNGAACPSSICTQISYSGGTLIFNVTSFSEYSATEAGTESSPSTAAVTGGSGGGGGGAIVAKGKFDVSDNYLPFRVDKGQSVFELITITNIGNIALDIDASVNPDYGIIKIEDNGNKYSFKLNPGESRKLKIGIENMSFSIPGLYMSLLIISDGQSKEEVPLIIDYSIGPGLLDVNINLLDNYDLPYEGGKLGLIVKLFNLGTTKRVDVTLKYSIFDMQKNLLMSKTETLAVETQQDRVIILQLPYSIENGTYVASVEAIYEGGVAVASIPFEVLVPVKLPIVKRDLILYMLGIFMVVMILMLSFIIIFLIIKNKKKRH